MLEFSIHGFHSKKIKKKKKILILEFRIVYWLSKEGKKKLRNARPLEEAATISNC